MTTTLDDTADLIVSLGRRRDDLEQQMTSTATLIATLAADGLHVGFEFRAAVGRYRDLRTELGNVKQAYGEALEGL